MAFAAFDTHKYVKRLTAAGMPEPQAEAIADEQRALIEDQLATKQDIKTLEAATKQDIAATRRDIEELRAEVKRDIKESEAATRREIKELETTTKRDLKELEQRLIIRLGIMIITSIVTAIAAVSALVKILTPVP